MSNIKNTGKEHEEKIMELRSAFEHRATWMGLLMKEARERGLDWDDFGRKAITQCGCIHGAGFREGMENPTDMVEFSNTFAVGSGRKIFDMEVLAADEDKYYLDFHYCPLVSAWQKLGFSDEDVEHLCDIAMDGDRGIASQFPDFTFTLGETIAQGKPACQIRFDKK